MDISFTIRGSGTDLLFQHGLGASQTQILDLLDGQEGIKLITSDSRGHGQSGLAFGQTCSFNRFASDAVEILNKSDSKYAVVGGLSMGAGIALECTNLIPDRIQGLILLRPAWNESPNPENLKILLKVAKYLREGLGKDSLMQDPEFRDLFSELPAARNSVLNLFEREDAITTARVLESMVNDHPLMAEVAIPTLIIACADDPLHPISIAEYWHDKIRGSKLKMVPSRYRHSNEHRKEVRKTIHRFINSLKK